MKKYYPYILAHLLFSVYNVYLNIQWIYIICSQLSHKVIMSGLWQKLYCNMFFISLSYAPLLQKTFYAYLMLTSDETACTTPKQSKKLSQIIRHEYSTSLSTTLLVLSWLESRSNLPYPQPNSKLPIRVPPLILDAPNISPMESDPVTVATTTGVESS